MIGQWSRGWCSARRWCGDQTDSITCGNRGLEPAGGNGLFAAAVEYLVYQPDSPNPTAPSFSALT
jgi:hypothetical protein